MVCSDMMKSRYYRCGKNRLHRVEEELHPAVIAETIRIIGEGPIFSYHRNCTTYNNNVYGPNQGIVGGTGEVQNTIHQIPSLHPHSSEGRESSVVADQLPPGLYTKLWNFLGYPKATPLNPPNLPGPFCGCTKKCPKCLKFCCACRCNDWWYCRCTEKCPECLRFRCACRCSER